MGTSAQHAYFLVELTNVVLSHTRDKWMDERAFTNLACSGVWSLSVARGDYIVCLRGLSLHLRFLSLFLPHGPAVAAVPVGLDEPWPPSIRGAGTYPYDAARASECPWCWVRS